MTPRAWFRRLCFGLDTVLSLDRLGFDPGKLDGIFGPQTKAAYGRFEKQVGGDGDGIPGRYSATLLGTARYNLLDKAA